MTVRVVMAVILAGALLAASMPAVEMAQAGRADQQVTDSTDRLVSVGNSMVRHSDPVPPGVPGAQRDVALAIPESHDATISLRNVPAKDERGDWQAEVIARVGDHATATRRLGTPIRIGRGNGSVTSLQSTVRFRTDERLWLTYRLIDGRPTLVLTR